MKTANINFVVKLRTACNFENTILVYNLDSRYFRTSFINVPPGCIGLVFSINNIEKKIVVPFGAGNRLMIPRMILR